MRLWPLIVVVFVGSTALAQSLPDPVPLPPETDDEAPVDVAPISEEQPDVVPAAETADTVESGEPVLPGTTVQEAQTAAEEEEKDAFELYFGGYLRSEFGTFTPDRFFFVKNTGDGGRARNPYVGRNDGFALATARFNVRGTYANRLYVRLAFDGAVANFENDNDPAGDLTTAVRDAYARFSVSQALQVFVGRFRPPWDVEQLTPEADQVFVQRAVESQGVARHEGFAADVPGFGTTRQAGIMLGSSRAIESGDMAYGYALAITNGSRGDRVLNDNDLPAFWLRLTASWSHSTQPRTDEQGPVTYSPQEGGIIGLGGFYNEVSFDVAPNRTHERVVGAGIDVAVRESVFDFRSQFLWQQTQPLLRVNTEAIHSIGGHAQLGIAVPSTGFMPAYRFAYYDGRIPQDADLSDTGNEDRVMLHTVGVRYIAETMPVRGWLEYTHSVEQGGRAIPNDRVEAALQVVFQ